MINKSIIAVLLLAIAGIIIVIYNTEPSDKIIKDEKKLLYKRIGILILGVCAIALVYLYYTDNISIIVKANMYPAKECSGCDVYAKRHDALRGYHEHEYESLKLAAKSCNNCSKICMNDLKQQKDRNAPLEIRELTRNECIGATQYALLAKKELDRISESLNKKKAGITAFKTRYFNDTSGFPKIPSY